MPFKKNVPISIAGPSYQSRSRPLSSQSTINFYQEFDESGKFPFVLQSWPGEDLHGSTPTNTEFDRGQHLMARVKYRVAGSTLYEVSDSGVHTARGTILGTARCIFANDGENMFIVNAGNVQQYNNVSKLLTPVTDPDIVGSIAVDFLNSRFIYTKPNLFITSAVGDGSQASGLDAAGAESQPDDLVRAYVFDQLVYMVGEETTEVWYDAGTGRPPLARIETQMFSIGTDSINSIAHNDNFMYWLGDDRQVYQASGGTQRRVSNKGISHAMENFNTVEDAVGWVMTIEGQNFYIISFPSENKTFAINEGLLENGWFQLSADNLEGKYNATSHLYLKGKHFVADESNGNLYQLNLDTFTNNGLTIQRTRVMASIHGGLFNAPGKEMRMSRFELILETGVGLISGQGEDPKIRIERSIDGGKSFGPAEWMRIGRLGETQVRAEWFNIETFTDLIIRIVTTDPVHYTIMSSAIDIKLVGR